MPLVLILSSHVAAGGVGGGAQVVALARLGLETALVPTVLYGRHPGMGAPGGGPVDPKTFGGVLAGLEAAGLFETLDAVICGYFASPEQVAIAADAIERVRAVNKAAWIVVDPVMGDDDKGLYVGELVAAAIAQRLIPRADLVAPNAWELERLTGREVADPIGAAAAARCLGRPVLVSSVRAGEEIGMMYIDGAQAHLAAHRRREAAPKGTGDLTTALFVAAVLGGSAPREALDRCVAAIREIVG